MKSGLARSVWHLSACLVCVSFARGAAANGRFPSADQLIVDPGDANHLLLRATFGLLDSRDGGRNWFWICEGGAGYSGATDPSVAVTADGSVVAVSLTGIAASHDRGCAWAFAPTGATGLYPVDVTVEGDAAHVLVVSASTGGSHQTRIFASSDNALTFAALGEAVGDDFFPTTLDVAPSRSERIYVTGLTNQSLAIFERSDDRGQTWERFGIAPYPMLQAYIAAVDPVDPDKVYVRVDDDPGDHLLVSDDAGAHFSEVLSLNSDLLGFALSPDGSRIAVSGPGESVYLASTADFAFQKTSATLASVRCLKWTLAGIYACAQETIDHFTLGLSSDDAASFTPLWHVTSLSPLECAPATNVGAKCGPAWPPIAGSIGADAGTSAAGAAGARASNVEPHGGCELGRSASGSRFGSLLTLGFLALLCGRRGRRHPHGRGPSRVVEKG